MSNSDSLAIASVKNTLASLAAYLKTHPTYQQLVCAMNTYVKLNGVVPDAVYTSIVHAVAGLFNQSQMYLNQVYGAGTFVNQFNQLIRNTCIYDESTSSFIPGTTGPQFALSVSDSTVIGLAGFAIANSCSGEDLIVPNHVNPADWGNDMASPFGGLFAPKNITYLAKPVLQAVASDDEIITTGFGFDPQADITMDQFCAVTNIKSTCFDNEPLGFLYLAIYQIGIPSCNRNPPLCYPTGDCCANGTYTGTITFPSC